MSRATLRITDAEILGMHVRNAIAHEATEHTSALGRAQVEVTRTGLGVGPNKVRELTAEGLQVVSTSIGFPVLGRTTFGDRAMIVILIVRSSPGSRWCEADLRPGMLLAYGPGTEHYGVSTPGVAYRFAIVDCDAVAAAADRLKFRTRLPSRGSVEVVSDAPATTPIREVLRRVGHPMDSGPAAVDRGAVLAALASTFAELPRGSRRPRSRIDSRGLVTMCIELADRAGSIPNMPELCRAGHVSERRLREAFQDVCAMAPNAFLRSRLLGRARQQLLSPEAPTVGFVAADLGFANPSRFATQYAGLFGERPNETRSRRPRSSPDRRKP